MGRTLIVIGFVVMLAGLILELWPKLGLGRLPGDIAIKGERWSFHFPITTSIILSIVLSVLLWLFGRFSR
jgi:uncharacterized protein HemY